MRVLILLAGTSQRDAGATAQSGALQGESACDSEHTSTS